MMSNEITITMNKTPAGCETWTVKIKVKQEFTWEELSEILGRPADTDHDVLKAALLLIQRQTCSDHSPIPIPFLPNAKWDGERWVEKS